MDSKRRKKIIRVFNIKSLYFYYLFFRLVDSMGRKWEQIGQELDRTAENCRDKYKSMGEERHLIRNSENWTVLEIIKLLKLVQKCVNKRFIDKNIEEKVLENLKNKEDKNNEIITKKKKTKKDVFDDQMVKK